jgi:hypothetical protein
MLARALHVQLVSPKPSLMPPDQSAPFRTRRDNLVSFNVRLSDPCPCLETDRALANCCFVGGKFVKPPKPTAPPPPKTGYSHANCYARDLHDCDEKLSREHYMSEAVLRYLDARGGLRASGFPWQRGSEPQQLPPDAFASRMLCTRHNSALSNLDAMALRLLAACDEPAGFRGAFLHLFSGHDIERWLLKVLCGMAVSKNLALDTGDAAVPTEWIEMLFDQREFRDQQGLYVCREPGHSVTAPQGVSIRAISNAAGISGVGVQLCSYEIVLSMTGFPTRKFDGRAFAFRPFELHTIGDAFEKSVVLSWQGQFDGGTIESTATLG